MAIAASSQFATLTIDQHYRDPQPFPETSWHSKCIIGMHSEVRANDQASCGFLIGLTSFPWSLAVSHTRLGIARPLVFKMLLGFTTPSTHLPTPPAPALPQLGLPRQAGGQDAGPRVREPRPREVQHRKAAGLRINSCSRAQPLAKSQSTNHVSHDQKPGDSMVYAEPCFRN